MSRTSFAAIIVAAGVGSRFGGPKHSLEIDGTKLWRLSVTAFEDAGITDVVVVGDVAGGVPGGDRRRDSVAVGLAEVGDPDWVLIHDAARPLVTTALVSAVMTAAAETDADGVIPVIPVTDTIKRVTGTRVEATIDRATLRAVQTPQAFRTTVLRSAHTMDPDDDVSDDAGLVERLGGRVTSIPGETTNIKITHPDDLAIARVLASRME